MNSTNSRQPSFRKNPHSRHPQRPMSSHYPNKNFGNMTAGGYQQHTSHQKREPSNV